MLTDKPQDTIQDRQALGPGRSFGLIGAEGPSPELL